jgi:hypothetical protein
MDNAHQARYVRNVLGNIGLGPSNRDRTCVLITTDLKPTAANEAEPAPWHWRRSDVGLPRRHRFGTSHYVFDHSLRLRQWAMA